jgi:hypothetical protein
MGEILELLTMIVFGEIHEFLKLFSMDLYVANRNYLHVETLKKPLRDIMWNLLLFLNKNIFFLDKRVFSQLK